MYDIIYLESLSRKSLQALAKSLGVKANAASSSIISDILSIPSTESTATEGAIETVTEATVTSIDEQVVSNNCKPRTSSVCQPSEVAGPFSASSSVELELRTRQSSGDYVQGDMVEALMSEQWVQVEVVRVNKKSVRVVNRATGWSSSLSREAVRTLPQSSTIVQLDEKSNEPSSNNDGTRSSSGSTRNALGTVVDDIPVESFPITIVEAQSYTMPASPALKNRNVSFRKRPEPIVHKSSRHNLAVIPKRSTFGGTPSKSPAYPRAVSVISRKPVLEPKPTKSQLARQEAISRKLKGDVTPAASQPSHVTSSVRASLTSASRGSVGYYARPTISSVNRLSSSGNNNTPGPALKPSSITATPGKSLLGVPDFSKAHEKQFQKSKSITDGVKRSAKVDFKIDNAFNQSAQYGYKHAVATGAVTLTPFKSQPVSSVSSNPRTQTTGKENAPNKLNPTKSTRMNKDSATILADKRVARREQFQASAKAGRQAAVASKRQQPAAVAEPVYSALPDYHDLPFSLPAVDSAGRTEDGRAFAVTGIAGPFSAIVAPEEY